MTTSCRRYLKRVWRVPKPFDSKGQPVKNPPSAAVTFGTLVLKAMRKHGWPAELRMHDEFDAFSLVFDRAPDDPPNDFLAAVSIAVRITASRYRVRVDEMGGYVQLAARYEVTASGQFREVA